MRITGLLIESLMRVRLEYAELGERLTQPLPRVHEGELESPEEIM